MSSCYFMLFFFFNDPATPEIYTYLHTLSLHDALPIYNAANRQRRETLARNWQALQTQAAHSSREIDATRAKALERIATEAQPVIAQVYQAKNCGLLFDRGAALGGHFANDLTDDVVRALDARIQTISVERSRLTHQQPAVPAPAQRQAGKKA